MGRHNLKESSHSLTSGVLGSNHDFGRHRSMQGDFAYEQNIMSVAATGKSNGKQRVIPDEDYKLLQSYFKEVGTESLLTATDELRIATKIKKYNARARKLEVMIGKLAEGSLARWLARLDSALRQLPERITKIRALARQAGLVAPDPDEPFRIEQNDADARPQGQRHGVRFGMGEARRHCCGALSTGYQGRIGLQCKAENRAILCRYLSNFTSQW